MLIMPDTYLCIRIYEISECSPTSTDGYDYMMDGVNYKKSKNNAFSYNSGRVNNYCRKKRDA